MIKTKVIETRLMPKGRFLAITLFGLVFTHSKKRIDKYVHNHELIHCQQQLEMLYLPFFIFYLIEWGVRLIQYRNLDKAYRNISFEREAYNNEYNLNYLRHRKLYSSFRYLRKKSLR